MPLSLINSQFIWRESYTNKSEGSVLDFVMGYFTDYFGMRDVRGKYSAYSCLGRLHRGDSICSKYNACTHLINDIILKVLIHISSSHTLTFSNLLAIRDRYNCGYSADADQRNLYNIKQL